MAGIAMFATTIPVLAAILSLYREGRGVGTAREPVSAAATG